MDGMYVFCPRSVNKKYWHLITLIVEKVLSDNLFVIHNFLLYFIDGAN